MVWKERVVEALVRRFAGAGRSVGRLRMGQAGWGATLRTEEVGCCPIFLYGLQFGSSGDKAIKHCLSGKR